MKKIKTKIKKEVNRLCSELASRMLTEEQCAAVKTMIINSMENAYTDKGEKPTDAFYGAAGRIADGVVNDVQKSLLQSSVFENKVKNCRPLKTKKTKK